jgi:hypothetical protein
VSPWTSSIGISSLIGPIQTERKRRRRLSRQFPPWRRHFLMGNAVIAEVDALAIQRVCVPLAGGVMKAADPI